MHGNFNSKQAQRTSVQLNGWEVRKKTNSNLRIVGSSRTSIPHASLLKMSLCCIQGERLELKSMLKQRLDDKWRLMYKATIGGYSSRDIRTVKYKAFHPELIGKITKYSQTTWRFPSIFKECREWDSLELEGRDSWKESRKCTNQLRITASERTSSFDLTTNDASTWSIGDYFLQFRRPDRICQ